MFIVYIICYTTFFAFNRKVYSCIEKLSVELFEQDHVYILARAQFICHRPHCGFHNSHIMSPLGEGVWNLVTLDDIVWTVEFTYQCMTEPKITKFRCRTLSPIV